MAEARKRARRKKPGPARGAGSGPEAEASASNAPEPAAATSAGPPPPPEPAAGAGGGDWESREEPMVFPADIEPPRKASGRLALPSSGLAEDILARADVAGLPETGREASIVAAPAGPSLDGPAAAAASAISFFGAPQREERKAVEATEHLATFFLAGEEYGVDVRLVQEIIRVSEITQVPRAPGFIKGVINLRGRIIPVVDLKRKLGLGEVERSQKARIVVVKVRDRLIGLLVDGASQVLRVPVSCIEPPPEEVVEINTEYIRGVAKLEARLIILVDLSRILALELREGSVEHSA